jgi:hypothetical protein
MVVPWRARLDLVRIRRTGMKPCLPGRLVRAGLARLLVRSPGGFGDRGQLPAA